MVNESRVGLIPRRINIVHVVVDAHGAIFQELIELIAECLHKCGIQVGGTTNKVLAEWLTLFIGSTMFLPQENLSSVRNLPHGYIVFQMEALDIEQGFLSSRPAYLEFLRGAKQVWDYSHRNVECLVRLGLNNVRYIPIGHSPNLERIPNSAVTDIDVLFYGSITPRRRHILDELRQRGFETVNLFGKYGKDRDSVVARAKIQLYIHQFQTTHLAHVRLSYLLNNRCFAISETSDENPYGDGVVFCNYEQLVEQCAYYLKPKMEVERRRIAQLGYEQLKLIPMAGSIMKALSEITSS